MTRKSPGHPAWNLVGVSTSAVLGVAIFWLASSTRSESLSEPLSFESLFLASIGIALVLPAARDRVDSLIARWSSGGRATPYEALTAVVPPLGARPSFAGAMQIASSTIAHALDTKGVVVRPHFGSRTYSVGSGGELPAWHTTISFAGDVYADVEVYKSGDLTESDESLVGDICVIVGLVANHAVVASELEARAREINEAVDLLERNRRLLVVAEQEHRSNVATLVVDRVVPLFDRLRAEIEAGDHEKAAVAAEDIIDFLRSVSAKVLAGTND